MADFKDLLLKIANNARLTSSELDDLGRFGSEIQSRNSFIAGNVTPGGALNVLFPFAPIFSEVLEVAKTSLTIPIPSGYKHLMVIANGRTNLAGQTAEVIRCQFNADAGANYDLEAIYRIDDVSGGGQDLAATGMELGTFAAADADANASGNCFCVIPNYISPFFKASVTLNGAYFTATAGAYIASVFGQWENTSKVSTLTIYPLNSPTSALLKDSAVSVYGIQ